MTMTEINSLFIILVIVYLLKKDLLYRLRLTIERTFWEKKPYGFIIWWRSKSHTSARGLFLFNWRDPDKIPDDINKSQP